MKLYSIAFTMDLDDDNHVPTLLAVVPDGHDIRQAAQKALLEFGLDQDVIFVIQVGLLLTNNEDDGSAIAWDDNESGRLINETGETFRYVVYPNKESGFKQILRKLRA